MVERQNLLEALNRVVDPATGHSLVGAKLVKKLELRAGVVELIVQTKAAAMHAKEELREACRQAILQVEGVKEAEVTVETSSSEQPAPPKRKTPAPAQPIPGVRHVIAVASGKGGVGKSTVAVNLAVALKQKGAKVGLLDADVYGPSTQLMLGKKERPELNEQGEILPINHLGLAFISMGLISDDATPVIWRGPMVHKMLQQFLHNVSWGELDYLIVDMPPGTGDAQLSLTQTTPLSGAIIVTTPQQVSLIDAKKGLRMFEEVGVTVLGIVENMSYFICPDCNHKEHIFGKAGGKKQAAESAVTLLGQIPLEPTIVQGGDTGAPIVLTQPESPATKAFMAIAERLLGTFRSKETSTQPANL